MCISRTARLYCSSLANPFATEAPDRERILWPRGKAESAPLESPASLPTRSIPCLCKPNLDSKECRLAVRLICNTASIPIGISDEGCERISVSGQRNGILAFGCRSALFPVNRQC